MIDAGLIANILIWSLLLYLSYRLALVIAYKRFDSRLYSYPLVFCHNGVSYNINVVNEELENQIPGAMISRSNIYINDNLVVVISRMRKMIFIERSIDMNLEHIDSFHILKKAWKAYR